MLKKLVLGLIDGAGLGVARMILLPVAAVCKASVQWQTTLHMQGVNVSVYLKRKYKRTNNDLQTHRTSKTLIVICINCIVFDISQMEPIRKNIREKFMLSKVLEHFVRIKVGLYSGCDSDATDLRCRFQHRYPIAATTHVIAHYR